MSRRRLPDGPWTSAVALIAPIALIVVLPAPPVIAAAPAQPGQGHRTTNAHANWRTKTASAVEDARAILTGKRTQAKNGQVYRLVSVAKKSGKPVVSTITVHGYLTAAKTIKDMQADPNLLSIEVDNRNMKVADQAESAAPDPRRSELWAMTRLHAEDSWLTTTGAGVKVAVVDTGVSSHVDLQGTILAGHDSTGAGGNGRQDGHGHGTHVSGTIAATRMNGIGVVGLAPDVAIIPIKVLDSSGSGYNSWVADGITWAADHDADIISMSLGGGYSDAVAVATAYAISQGVVVVAAAGNSRQSGSPISYPGALPGVVGVAATDSNDAYAYFSNAGSYIDVAAPGVGVLSTIPTNTYASWSGTSMATPHVSALAALIKARATALHRTVDIPTILMATAHDLGAAGRDNDYGYGLIDPGAALAAVAPDESLPVPGAPHSVAAEATGPWTADVSWEAGDSTEVVNFTATASPGGVGCSGSTAEPRCHLTGLAPATEYLVTVTATNTAGTSAPSTAVAFTTAARNDAAGDTFGDATAMPAELTVDEVIDNANDVDFWSFTTDRVGRTSVGLTNLPADYDIQLFDDQGVVLGYSSNWNSADESIALDLGPGTYIVAVYPYGAFDIDHPYRLTVTPAQRPPAPPTKVGATPGNGRALVRWTAPTDTGDGVVTGYQVTSTAGLKTCSGLATICAVAGLTNGERYRFQVRVLSTTGSSDYSTRSNQVMPVGKPSAPSFVRVTTGDSKIRVRWSPAAGGGLKVLSYTAQSQRGGLSCTTTRHSCLFGGLTRGANYSFTVTATTSFGTSPASNSTRVVKVRG